VLRAATLSSSERHTTGVSSAKRRMRAWQSLRAAALPVETRRSTPTRSSVVSVAHIGF
jgi:hypothetical protein